MVGSCPDKGRLRKCIVQYTFKFWDIGCAVMSYAYKHSIKYFRDRFSCGLRCHCDLPSPGLLVVVSVGDRVNGGFEADVLTEFEVIAVELEVLEHKFVVHEVWELIRDWVVTAGTWSKSECFKHFQTQGTLITICHHEFLAYWFRFQPTVIFSLRLRSCLFCEGRISVLKRWFKTPIQNAVNSGYCFELKWTGKAFIWRHLNVVIMWFCVHASTRISVLL